MALESNAETVWIECEVCSGSGRTPCHDCDGEGGRMGVPDPPRTILHRWLVRRLDGSTEYGRGDQPLPALQEGERLWFTYREVAS